MSPLLLSLLSITLGANPEAKAKLDDTAKLEAAAKLDAAAKLFEEHTYKYTGGDYKDEAFKWRLLKPETIEPGKKYPVILFLHGSGERGDDNKMQLKYFGVSITTPENRKQFPCFVIAPQCRLNKTFTEKSKSNTPGDPSKAPSDQAKVALGILDEVVKDYPVDDKRLYLTGLSMGGEGSWYIAMHDPDKFACIVPICGRVETGGASRLTKLPVWCFHGGADTSNPVQQSRDIIAAIKKAGGDPKYTEYPGVGHNSWDQTYDDPKGAIPWMFEQHK